MLFNEVISNLGL
jgi:hypothetical protein